MILAASAGCSCPAEFAVLPTGRIVRQDAGGLDCSKIVEVEHPPELDLPWNPGPSSEFGIVLRLFDGGVVVREIILSPKGSADESTTWPRREISPQMNVNILGRDGTLCGTTRDDAGHPQLRLELIDGGSAEPPSRGNCLAYANGWWASWENGNVVRGRSDWSETLGNWDAGVIPGVLPPGVVPSVEAISDDGEVGIFVNYRRPGSWLLPSGVELRAPANEGTGYVLGFTNQGPYGSNYGAQRVPIKWDARGDAEPLNIGDAGTFVQLISIYSHSDGHFCGSVELAGAAFDSAVWWIADGGYVGPGFLRAHGVSIDPVQCRPIGDDWYFVTHYPDAKLDGGLSARGELVRLRLNCLTTY